MELHDVMDLETPGGSKIRFSFPDAGYPYDQNTAKKFLKVNKIYTVDYVISGDWESTVYLVEVPSMPFNTVLFENV